MSGKLTEEGAALLARGDFDEAIRKFDDAIAVDPDCGPKQVRMQVNLFGGGGAMVSGTWCHLVIMNEPCNIELARPSWRGRILGDPTLS
jgi:hypothetical protein